MSDICYCGKSFLHPGALQIHQRSCSRGKKRLGVALDKAKELWNNRKRRRIHESVVQGSGQSNLQGAMVAAQSSRLNNKEPLQISEVRPCSVQ
jgi:hypothetical protein